VPWFLAVTTDYFCTYVTRKTTWLELGFRIARLKTLTGSLWWNWLWNWPTQNYTDQHRFSHDLTQELVSVFSHDPLEAGCSALRTTANWSASLAASAKVLGLWSINQSRRSLSTLLLNCLHTMRSRAVSSEWAPSLSIQCVSCVLRRKANWEYVSEWLLVKPRKRFWYISGTTEYSWRYEFSNNHKC